MVVMAPKAHGGGGVGGWKPVIKEMYGYLARLPT